MIKYVKGDLFNLIKPKTVIPHVVNNAGKMARGFVVPLCRKYPIVKSSYIDTFNNGALGLGTTHFITVENQVVVANMTAQTLYDRRRPLRYNYLVECMEFVGNFAWNYEYSILAPKFGSELAGGNWDFIEELIYDIWIAKQISVTVVEYQK